MSGAPYHPTFLGALVKELDRLRTEAEVKLKAANRRKKKKAGEKGEDIEEDGWKTAWRKKSSYFVHGNENPIALD